MNSIIAWIGGKRLLRKKLETLIPKDIRGYIEPFGGAGWVLLLKEKWAKLEVYNDLDSRLTNLFLQVKYHPEALKKEFEYLIGSRDMFKLMKANPGLTEIQKAARFMYLISRSFGSKGETFATAKTQGHAKLENKLNRFDALSTRLDGVIIENLSFEDLIKRYDTKENFFYCDPPYMNGFKYDNAKDFDHRKLYKILTKIKGRFLLSYDDCPQAREMYKKYNIISVSRVKGINRISGDSFYKEIIISNYEVKNV